ncbi:MlaD family protein [Saccharopolyspora sp. NPDC049426]|uniref:MlaD family protein n=1 Tax=Saccharopolyspora sp. NPDC049426 TaxID=3155652 RepID=UPI0034394CFA
MRTEPGLGRNVAALAALIVLGLAVGGYILSNQQANWPWQDRFAFAADFQASPGVTPGQGQEVRIAGVRAGDIRGVQVTEDGRGARVQMALERGHTVYDNARLVLRPKSPLNEMYVELDPGTPPGKKLEEGGVLPVGNTQRPIQPDEVLAHLDGNSRAALTSLLSESDVALVHAPTELPPGLRAGDRVVTELRPVVEALQTRRDAIRQLVTALSQISGAVGKDDERLTRLANSMEQTLGAVAGRDGELNAALNQLPGVTDELRRATGGVQQLSGQLDPTLRNVHAAADTLPEALSRLNGTVGRLDQTVDAARPVVQKARPMVADLRPLIGDAKASLVDIEAVTQRLDPATSMLMPYLTDLRAFVYNTNSVVNLQDANGGILRGLLEVSPTSLPVKSPLPPR